MTKEPIRVLHVIGVMNRGGAETMIMNLYRNIDRRKIQFDFVVHTSEKAAFDTEIIELGGRIYHCPKFNVRNFFSYEKWWSNFWQNEGKEYEIVHGHIGSTAAIYLKIAKKYGKYTIAHSHSAGVSHNVKGMLYKIISYNTRNVADYFFACSQEAGLKRFGKKVCSGDINFRILHNAIDTKLFRFNSEVRDYEREQLRVAKEDFLVGHVGRFTAEKNHTFILDVFKTILDKKKNSLLILVGDGPLRKSIENKARDIGIENRVVFLGVRSDVNALMQAMDVLVFPSLYEGLPLTMIEAQASGLPIVVSDRVSAECICTNKLVTRLSLEDSATKWAEEILNKCDTARADYREEIAAAGYDIAPAAEELQRFYLMRV